MAARTGEIAERTRPQAACLIPDRTGPGVVDPLHAWLVLASVGS